MIKMKKSSLILIPFVSLFSGVMYRSWPLKEEIVELIKYS